MPEDRKANPKTPPRFPPKAGDRRFLLPRETDFHTTA